MNLLNNLKNHLNIEQDYEDDDVILYSMIDVASVSITNFLNFDSGYTYDEDTPLPIIHGLILLSAHFYLNRNMITFSNGVELPYSFRFLLEPYKNFTIQ